MKNNAGQVNDDPSEPPGSFVFSTDALLALNCLTILTRSMHNCKVFSYYGGVQKITALLKGIWNMKSFYLNVLQHIMFLEYFVRQLIEFVSYLSYIINFKLTPYFVDVILHHIVYHLA